MTSEIDLREPITIDEQPVGHPDVADAEKVEQAVFLKRFGDTPEDFDREYGPIRERSAMVVARRGDRVVATTRVAWADGAGRLKTLEDAASKFNVDVDGFLASVGGSAYVLDALTISAVDHSPGTDGRSIGGSLTVAMGYLAARKRSCTHVVSFLDEVIFEYLVTEYGVPWEPLPGAVFGPYMGSSRSVPAVVDVAATAARSFGDLHAITNGRSGDVSVLLKTSIGVEETLDLTDGASSDIASAGSETNLT